MTDRSRWGFEALDDAEYDQFVAASSTGSRSSQRTTEPAYPTPEAEDVAVVDVVLDEDGRVCAVHLAPRWHRRLAPDELGDELARVANARAVERLSRPAPEASGNSAAEGPVDLSPWGGSLERLTAAAQQDLAHYERVSGEAGHREVAVRSVNGAVTVTGHAGLIDTVVIDALWLRRARHDDVEAELTGVLATARAQMAPVGVAAGPAAPASRVLVELARRPAELLRAAGLLP